MAALLALVAGCGPKQETPRTLLLISIDTLRADRFGAYGSDLGITPRMDELAAESLVFESAYAPASFTVPSVSAMLTGWYPEQNGILTNEHMLPASAPTLATMLADRGYLTGAVVSNFVLRAGGGLERDFDRYDAEFPGLESMRGIPERLAKDTTDRALEVLDELKGSDDAHVFLWVHYQDPHGPYTPADEDRAAFLEVERARPDGRRLLSFGTDHRGIGELPNYQRIGGENEVAFYRAGYDAEVRSCDREIGRLLDGLRARRLYDEAVIVLAADHGEGLGENDYWFAHGEYLTDAVVRVPLFLHLPGVTPGRRTDPACLTDIVPTLAPRFVLAAPSGIPGRDLLAPDAAVASPEIYMSTVGGSSLPRMGLVRDGHKYLITQRRARSFTENLFRLGEEDRDLAVEDAARLVRMRERSVEIQREVHKTGEERQRAMTDEERARMDKIGYGGGGH